MKHCPNSDCTHLQETGRAGEFRDDIVRCSDCGTPLVAGEAPEQAAPVEPVWVSVTEVTDPHAANLVRTALAAESIPCEFRRIKSDAEGMVPGRSGAAQVMVPEAWAGQARGLLQQQAAEPIPLPDDEDLEFITGDEPQRGDEMPEPATSRPQQTAGGTACPRCDRQESVTRMPAPGGTTPGVFSRFFRSPASHRCVACGYRWAP